MNESIWGSPHFLLETLYIYSKITSIISSVPSSFFDCLTDLHNYEFMEKTPLNLSVLKAHPF